MANTGREDVVADVVAIVSSCCVRRHGERRAKRAMETIVGALRSPHGLVAQEQAQEVAEDATR
jgi:hypothetical protein